MSIQESQQRIVDRTKVICPACTHQFRAIPVDVQGHIAELEAENAARLKASNGTYALLETERKRVAQLENAIAIHRGLLGSGLAHNENERLWAQLNGVKVAPYPFCHHPWKCRETGRCEKEICCND